jgi:hypothetical protein
MMRRSRLISGLLIAVMALLSGPAASAQSGPQVTVTLRSYGEGTKGGGRAESPESFIVGQPFTVTKFAGDLSRGDHSVCTIGLINNHTVEDLLNRRPHVWTVTVTPLAYEDGRAKMRLEWSRYKSGSGQKPVASQTLELQLGEGERRPLDMLHADGASQCPGESVVLDVSADVVEDPAVADELLRYDLWLVHKDAQGREIRRQYTATVRHGGLAEYAFAPVRFQVPEQPGSERRFDVLMTLKGSIRGRLEPGGKVRVQLESLAARHLGVRGKAPAVRGPAGRGRKGLEVTPGEAIEIKIPAPNGWTAMATAEGGKLSGRIGVAQGGPNTAPPNAVSVADGAIRVSYEKFFEGHETSLILKVTRVQ